MARKKTRKSKKIHFLYFAPLLIIIGLGVFVITARRNSSSVACSTIDLSGNFIEEEKLAFYKGQEFNVPEMDLEYTDTAVLGLADINNRWIEVDLSEQKLRAWDGNSLFLETPVSTGLPWWPTPKGEYRIWVKLRATKMEGGQGRNYYYLPNVPYVMYFYNDKVPSWRGYGLHGTYWHNDFGNQRSHGCVNLPTPIAEKLYYWVGPVLPSGKGSTFASGDNPGTRIVIHD
jgi:hypothetical protein